MYSAKITCDYAKKLEQYYKKVKKKYIYLTQLFFNTARQSESK